MTTRLIVSVINKPDSIAGAILLKKLSKDYKSNSEILEISKSTVEKIAEKLLTAEYKDITFVGFIPHLDLLSTLKDNYNLFAIHYEPIGDDAKQVFETIKVYEDTSISNAIFMEHAKMTEKEIGFVAILDNIKKYDKNSYYYHLSTLLSPKMINRLLHNNENDMLSFKFAASMFTKSNDKSAKKMLKNINVININGIAIPVFNINKELIEPLSALYLDSGDDDLHEIVGFYNFGSDWKVQMSIRSKGNLPIKELFEATGGSGSRFLGGFSLTVDEFNKMRVL